MDDLHLIAQTKRCDGCQRPLIDIAPDLNPDRVSFEFLRGGDHNSAVPAAQIVNHFTRPDLRNGQHLVHYRFGRRVNRSQRVFVGKTLGFYRPARHYECQNRESKPTTEALHIYWGDVVTVATS